MALGQARDRSATVKHVLTLVAAAILVLGLSLICNAASVVFVYGGAQSGGNGSSWGQAVQSIQQGVDIAAATGGEVWVRSGVYDANIYLKTGVYVYGGFAGWESQRNQRNTTSNPTIIDGGRRGSVVSAVEVTGCGIDGFTIRNGSGTVFYTGTYLSGTIHGGGVYIHRSNVVVNNNTLTGNIAPDTGGAIHAHRSTVTITNNIFRGNRTTETLGSGGAIYFDVSNGSISYNTFVENECNWDGGGIHCTFDSSPIIERNLFVDNRAGAGGGIHANFGCSPRILNNTLVGNWARNGGGAVSVYKDCAPVLVGNIISENSADEGGAFKNYVDASSVPSFAYNDFFNNGANPFNNIPNPIGSTGNIGNDPRFVNAATGDFHIQDGSPCINTGDPSITDSDGTRSDMGALPTAGPPQVDAPPNCWITSSPPARSNNQNVAISWSGSDDRTPADQLQYSYRFDNENWSGWTIQTQVTRALALGTHKFEVIARDSAGNTDPTPASVAFEIVSSELQISGIRISDISSNSARITWQSDQPGYGVVDYGLNYAFDSRIESGILTTDHQVSIGSLLPDRIYYFRVTVTTAAGESATSAIYNFRTEKQTAGSVRIYSVQLIKVGSDGYVVSWRTDLLSTSIVEWGPTLGYGNSRANEERSLSHMMYTEQFYQHGTYHIRAKSYAANGAVGYSNDIVVVQ